MELIETFYDRISHWILPMWDEYNYNSYLKKTNSSLEEFDSLLALWLKKRIEKARAG